MNVTLPKLMAYGAHLCKENKWTEAVTVFQRCLEVNPRYIDALYNLGVCYANLGNFKAALENYEQVLRLNSVDVEANYNSGVAYAKLDDLSSAIDAYKKTLELDDRYVAAWVNLAECYYSRGLRALRLPYQQASGRPVPVSDDQLHTFFGIAASSDEGLLYIKTALQKCEDVCHDFKLASDCVDEAMRRVDDPGLRFALEGQRKALNSLLGV